jgi:hypothetical protein
MILLVVINKLISCLSLFSSTHSSLFLKDLYHFLHLVVVLEWGEIFKEVDLVVWEMHNMKAWFEDCSTQSLSRSICSLLKKQYRFYRERWSTHQGRILRILRIWIAVEKDKSKFHPIFKNYPITKISCLYSQVDQVLVLLL